MQTFWWNNGKPTKKTNNSKKKDTLILDKGYYSYENYQIGINKYKIVPFIFPRDNFKRNKLNDQLLCSLQTFKKTKKIITEKKILRQFKTRITKKTRQLEEIQTNSRKNRRLF